MKKNSISNFNVIVREAIKEFLNTKQFKKEIIFILCLYLIFLIFFFFKAFTGTFMHGDFIAYWVPHNKFILDWLHQGTIPFWQPYSYLGLPELFKLELTIFYPPTFILLLINYVFNPTTNLTILGKSMELLQYCNLLIGALGMYIFLRKVFSTTKLTAFFCGLIFIFSFYITIQAGDLSSMPGKLYLPWVFLVVINFFKKNTFKNYLYVVVINYIILTLGYPYNFVYFFIAQFFLSFLYGIKKSILNILAILNSFLIASFFLLPGYYILTQSFRGTQANGADPLFHFRYSFFPTKIINIFDPIVFSQIYSVKDPQMLFSLGMIGWGVIPLLLLVIGFATIKVNKLNTYFILIFILSFIFSLGGYLNVPGLLGTIVPVIEKFRTHTQILSLAYFSGVIIISQGLEAILNGLYPKKTFFILWQFIILFIFYLLISPFNCQSCTNNMYDVVISLARSTILLIMGMILLYFTIISRKKIFIVTIIVITLLEYSFYAENIPYLRMPTSYQNYYNQNSIILDSAKNNPSFRTSFTESQFIYNTSFFKLFNTQGYETVPYPAFYRIGELGEERMFQFTNTKYIITTQANKEKDISSLKLVKEIDPQLKSNEIYYGTIGSLPYFSLQKQNKYYIYEEKNYLPRFYIPNKAMTCGQSFCPISNKFLDSVFTKEENVNIDNPPNKTVKLFINKYEPNTVILTVNTSQNTFIASSEIWDKGWDLTINGKKSVLYNVSNGFRGIIVPSGKSVVIMNYTPPYLKEGIFVSLIGLLLLFTCNRIYQKKINLKWQ